MNRDDDASNRLADDARSRIHEITPRELARFKKLPLIIDVREKDEFVRGHINGARHISRNLFKEKVCEIAPDRSSPIVCIAHMEIEAP